MGVRGRPATAHTMAHLTYFAGWGLAAADIEFTQTAFETHDQFTALQDSDKLLFRQLPLLEIDGLNLVQSQAMIRYVARRSGLDGDTPAQAALNDMLCEGIRDCRGLVVMFPFNCAKMTPEEIEAQSDAMPTAVAKQMVAFEKTLTDNPAVGFLESGLCTADVLLCELVEELTGIREDTCAAYPKVLALHQRVRALPQIAKYLESDRRFPLAIGEVGTVYVANVNAVLGR